MCGIIGILARDDKPVTTKLIKAMEHQGNRGYDGAGIIVQNSGKADLYKTSGKLDNLLKILNPENVSGGVGIAHNRWATHGSATDNNAHPHLSNNQKIAVVHNGIISNYQQIKAVLGQEGYTFKSQTDTEVIPNLIQNALLKGARNLSEAVMCIIPMLEGEYAFLVISQDNPHEIVATAYERPLIFGKSDSTYSLASTEIALSGLAKEVFELDDHELVSVTKKDFAVHKKGRSDWQSAQKKLRPLTVSKNTVTKEKFSTFLEKEICEQPQTVGLTLLSRLINREVSIPLQEETLQRLSKAEEITAVACGTSYHALLVAKKYFEEIAGMKLNIELASEFQNSTLPLKENGLLIAVSQSGETADTVKALVYAKVNHNAYTLSITNNMSSQLTRKSHDNINVQAGPEISVASTKAYTAQVITLLLLAIKIGKSRGRLEIDRRNELIEAVYRLKKQVEKTLLLSNQIQELSKMYRLAKCIIIIGKGYAVPASLEGALKIQEIAYQHAFAFPAGELKHGPLALVTDDIPVIVIATCSRYVKQILSSIEEIKARNGKVIAIVSEGTPEEETFKGIANHTISLPNEIEEMTPILSVIVMQFFALYLGLERGNEVDTPRNLAKTVTVG